MIEITLTQYIAAIASTALAFYLLGVVRSWEDMNYNERTGRRHRKRY